MSSLDNMSVEELRVVAGYDSPQKKEGSKIGKYAAMIPRSLAAAPGYLSDLVNLPLNLLGRAAHKAAGIPYQEHPGHGEQIKQTIDKITKNYARPETKGEKILEAALDVVGPGKVSSAKTLAGKIGKTAASKIPQTTGAAIGEASESATAGIGTAVGLSLLGGKGPKVLSKLAENAKLSRLKRNPELKKKVIAQLAEEARPAKYGNVPNQVGGEKAIKSAENYKEKSEKVFGNIFDRVEARLNKHITGENKGNRFIDSTDAEMFAIQKMLKLESQTSRNTFMNSPLGKQLAEAQAIRREGRRITVREAEQMRRNIGDLNSTAGAIGTGSQGELRGFSGHLKKEIGLKYKEAGPQAQRDWNRSHKHYTLHKKKNVGPVNKTLELQHEPEEAFTHSIKNINKGASNLKRTLQYLKGKDKRTYAKSVIFDLGKKEDAWDPITFYKKYAEIPSKNKKLLMKSVGKKEASNLKTLDQQLKTMESSIGRKSGLEIAGEFAPRGIKKWMHPIQAGRQNNYLESHNVKKVVDALKRKTQSTAAPKGKKELSDFGLTPAITKHLTDQTPHGSLANLSVEELRKIAGYAEGGSVQHHAKGDRVTGNKRSLNDADLDNINPYVP